MTVSLVADAAAVRPVVGVNVQMVLEVMLELKPSAANVAFVDLFIQHQVRGQVLAVSRELGQSTAAWHYVRWSAAHCHTAWCHS